MNIRFENCDFDTFRGLFIARMSKVSQFREDFKGSELKWEGPNGIVIRLYEDFVLMHIPIIGLAEEEGEFAQEDGYKLVKHIPFIQALQNVEFLGGVWFADFSVDFHGNPEHLVNDIANIFKEEAL